MKHLKDFSLSNKEWAYVKRRFIKFYQTENRCNDKCPMEWDLDRNFKNKISNRIYDKHGDVLEGKCICHQFKEFAGIKKCPCNAFEQKAFIKLETLVKREFM